MKLSIVILTYNRKDKVVRCVETILCGNTKDYELIVVDNGSTDGTAQRLEELYAKDGRFRLLHAGRNLGVAGGRNYGLAQARGEYVAFVDDDNVATPDVFAQLVDILEENADIGMAAPVIFFDADRALPWSVGSIWNFYTAHAKPFCMEKEKWFFEGLRETSNAPHLFLVRRESADRVGGFDPLFHVMFEEYDFAEKIRALGYRLVFCASAVTYHDTPLPSPENKLRNLGLETPERAWHFAKNRWIFEKRFARWDQFLVSCLLSPVFPIYYCGTALLSRRPDIAWAYFKGYFAGIRLCAGIRPFPRRSCE